MTTTKWQHNMPPQLNVTSFLWIISHKHQYHKKIYYYHYFLYILANIIISKLMIKKQGFDMTLLQILGTCCNVMAKRVLLCFVVECDWTVQNKCLSLFLFGIIIYLVLLLPFLWLLVKFGPHFGILYPLFNSLMQF